MPKGDKLTPKQELFVNSYIKHWNATRAYKEAGYAAKTDVIAASEGFKLLRIPKVDKAIRARLDKVVKKTDVTIERWLEEVSKIAFFDASTCYYTYTDEEGNVITQLKPVQYLDGSVIKEITDKGTIKGWDKAKALEMMGKYLAVFTENMNLNHTGEVNTSSEDTITVVQELIEENPELGRQLLDFVVRRRAQKGPSESKPNGI